MLKIAMVLILCAAGITACTRSSLHRAMIRSENPDDALDCLSGLVDQLEARVIAEGFSLVPHAPACGRIAPSAPICRSYSRDVQMDANVVARFVGWFLSWFLESERRHWDLTIFTENEPQTVVIWFEEHDPGGVSRNGKKLMRYIEETPLQCNVPVRIERVLPR